MDTREARNFIENNRQGWKTFDSASLALTNNDDRLIRAIHDVREDEFYAVANFLREYADPGNIQKSAIVVDPVVERGPVPGTWRHVSTYLIRTDSNGRKNPDGKHFSAVQELRRGFLTSLDYDEARLIEDRVLPGDTGSNNENKRITLQWTAVDPDLVDSLKEAQVTTAEVTGLKHRRAIVTEPELATVSIDATGLNFYHQGIKSEIGEDGTATVTYMVGDTRFELSGFSSWLGSGQTAVTDYFNVPEQLAQSVIDAATARGADAFAVGYNDTEALVHIRARQMDLNGVSLTDVPIFTNCDKTTTASFLWGTGDSSLLPIPGTIPAGTTYDRSVSERGDGTFNIVLRKTVKSFRDITEYDAAEDGATLTERKEWLGVTDEATQVGAANLVTDVLGKQVRVRKNFQDDCSIDITREIISPFSQTTTNTTESRADRTSSSEKVTNDALPADASGGGVGSGVYKVASSRKNEFDLYDNETTTVTSIADDTGWYDSGANRYGDTYKRVATNQSLANAKIIATSTPGAGLWLVNGSISEINAFGLYDVSVSASVSPFNVTVTRDPYDEYSTTISVQKIQFREIYGVSQYRYVNMDMKVVGRKNPSDLTTDFASHFDVQINPNATGTYFQGQGYKYSSVPSAWQNL